MWSKFTPWQIIQNHIKMRMGNVMDNLRWANSSTNINMQSIPNQNHTQKFARFDLFIRNTYTLNKRGCQIKEG